MSLLGESLTEWERTRSGGREHLFGRLASWGEFKASRWFSRMVIRAVQRWDDHLRRLSWHGQVLGFTDMYPTSKFRGPWRGCALLSSRTGTRDWNVVLR